jgi:hypothetical protein
VWDFLKSMMKFEKTPHFNGTVKGQKHPITSNLSQLNKKPQIIDWL